MTIRIRTISAVDHIETAGPLIREHWEEVAKNKDVMVLAPNMPVYRALEEAGCLLSVGAFDDEVLIGYSVSIVTNHLHYAGLLYATNDVIFVGKTHRSGRAGLMLMRETERLAAERGVRLMLWHAKPDTALDSILPRMGYGVQDVIYSKRLGD